VLVSFEGEVKLCDFGIARALNGGDAPGDAIEGKASYMSPEHARGDSVDARADVFSASVILWELVAGRRMYRAQPGVDLITLARNGDTPELPDRDLPDLERLRAIVRKGLAKSPADRYATAHAMVRELDDYVMDNRLMATPMALGEFVVEHFGQEILELRRARERAAIAMESSGADAQASEWDDATAIERSPLAETPVTLPHAPTTDTERDASVSVERGTTNWPSAFPPPAVPSIPPPSGIHVPQSIDAPQRAPSASSQSESRTMMLRLVGLVLGALVTIALGALILGRR
jgi:serine/threonine-protein kinase